jgi:hypothetical protein
MRSANLNLMSYDVGAEKPDEPAGRLRVRYAVLSYWLPDCILFT